MTSVINCSGVTNIGSKLLTTVRMTHIDTNADVPMWAINTTLSNTTAKKARPRLRYSSF